MRRRVSLLVAVITTAIVASFVIPLLLLVQTVAADRGMALADQQANSVAVLVSSLHDDPRLPDLLQPTLAGSPSATSVVLPDGRVIGTPWPQADTDAGYQRALRGEAFSVADGEGARVYVPVVIDGGVTVIRTQMTAAQLQAGVPLAWASIIGLGVLLTGAAILVAAEAGRRVSRPLLAVAGTAHRLREGELTARAPLAGTPETIELGAALNGLADRIVELLAAERDTVRGLAHRLRTPVTALRLEAENVTDPEVRADLAELVGQLQVAIDDAVREARRGLREDLRAGCDAVAVVGARVDYWTPLAEDQGRSTTVTMPKAPLRVGLSALELGDVVDVCIDNIFAHTPEGTAFEVRLVAEPDRAELSISDHGPGFPQERQARPGSSGEGLHIVRRLAQRVGGSVRTSPVGRPGAEVTVRLPLVDRP